jgi:hypothetical protein
MYSVNLKKDCAKRIYVSKFCDSLALKSIKRSVINIQRSMLDVQSVHCSGQAEFHTSPAAGQENGRPD